jgi:hypothetical protein
MSPHPRKAKAHPPAPGGGWLRWALTRLALAALLAYVASYVYLYERGVAEADAFGYQFFFYTSFETVLAERDLTRHYQLRTLYAPINRAHRSWFGGRDPCGGILWGLSR